VDINIHIYPLAKNAIGKQRILSADENIHFPVFGEGGRAWTIATPLDPRLVVVLPIICYRMTGYL